MVFIIVWSVFGGGFLLTILGNCFFHVVHSCNVCLSYTIIDGFCCLYLSFQGAFFVGQQTFLLCGVFLILYF